MTDILNNLSNDVGSDHEDIQKLFPKCKVGVHPKSPSSSAADVNLNKIINNQRDSSRHVYNQANKNRDSLGPSAGHENQHHRRCHVFKNNASTAFLTNHYNENLLQNSTGSGSDCSPTNVCHVTTTHSDNTDNYYRENSAIELPPVSLASPSPSSSSSSTTSSSSSQHSSQSSLQLQGEHMVVDNSVVSAYDRISLHDMQQESNGHKLNGSVGGHGHGHHQGHRDSPAPAQVDAEDEEHAYDESLDVGYRIPVMRKEFKLRESRIEIAGGREVFSSSRSRPSSKKNRLSGGCDVEIQCRPSMDHHHRADHAHAAAYQLKTRKSSAGSAAATLPFNGQWSSSASMKHNRSSKGRSTSMSSSTSITNHRKLYKVVSCNVDDSPSAEPLHNNVIRASLTNLDKNGQDNNRKSLADDHDEDEDEDNEDDDVSSKTRGGTSFVLKGQRSGMFIYETVVRGPSEVVYDDIEDRTLSTFSFKRQPALDKDEDIDDDDVGPGLSSSSSSFAIRGEGPMDTALELAIKTCDLDENSPSVDVMSVTQLIGSLPITQYEGSPRRYGPRPGHPQRMTMVSNVDSTDGEIVTNNDVMNVDAESDQAGLSAVAAAGDCDVNENEEENAEDEEEVDGHEGAEEEVQHGIVPPSFSTYDYLYEESETRKVLEEFYHQDGLFERLKAAAAAGGGTLSAEAFNELEYRLYRNHAGNSYVGRRLAHSNLLGDQVEDSPKKRPRSSTSSSTSNVADRAQQHMLLRDHLLAAMAGGGSASAVDVNGKPCLSRENLYNFNLELGAAFDGLMEGLREEGQGHAEGQTDHHAGGGAGDDGVEEAAKSNVADGTEDLAETEVGEQVGQSRNFTLSPETTECDSNDVESEVSMDNEGSMHSSSRQYASMPVLEDGLSSGHSSDAEGVAGRRGDREDDNDEEVDDDDDDDDVDDDVDDDDDDDGNRTGGDGDVGSDRGSDKRLRSSDHHVLTTLMMKKQISEIEREIARRAHSQQRSDKSTSRADGGGGGGGKHDHRPLHLLQQQHFQEPHVQASPVDYREVEDYLRRCDAAAPHNVMGSSSLPNAATSRDIQPLPLMTGDPLEHALENAFKGTASSPNLACQVQRPAALNSSITCESVSEAINEIKQAIQRTKSITLKSPPMEKPETEDVPVWVLRPAFKHKSIKDEEGRTKEDGHEEDECDTDQETDRLLGKQRSDDPEVFDETRLSDLPSTQPPSSPITNADSTANLPSQEKEAQKKKGRTKEVLIHEPAVLIEGVLFRARYLGSTQLVCEGQPTKATRMMQAEEAVSSIKAPEGETQPSTEVDLFISTEKIMVLNTDLKEIMMDHALRTISYIADIGDLVVLMARRRVMSTSDDLEPKLRRTPKMICHVFESEEAQFIAQSIGQAFQVAYMEFLKANGIEDHSFVKEMDYQEVLNSQEIYGDELEMFAKKEMQKEVIVPKLKGEILGVVIVESGWGSMLPTVVIANLSPNGAAARCGQLNIGDQIIAVNGISLVGLPLSTCQTYVKNAKNQTVVKLTVVPCAPVVEVKIKRPDTKYQLGFSVQNGVICSLLRGGIAERGGVRVGHRIIEINGQSVVAVPHERIVNLLATSVGEIHMKTMPTSMFRLLTGQESPIFI